MTAFRRQVLHVGPALVILLVALATALAVAAAQPLRKVTVVSFGLFGGQDVFRSEATGAAQIVASRFGADPVIVRFNSRKNADATIETLAKAGAHVVIAGRGVEKLDAVKKEFSGKVSTYAVDGKDVAASIAAHAKSSAFLLFIADSRNKELRPPLNFCRRASAPGQPISVRDVGVLVAEPANHFAAP